MRVGEVEIKSKGDYTLLRPIDFEGEKVTKLTYDLDELTGAHLCQAASSMGGNPADKMLLGASPEYQAAVFAKAASVPIELIMALKAQDFTEVTSTVQLFLMASSGAVESEA